MNKAYKRQKNKKLRSVIFIWILFHLIGCVFLVEGMRLIYVNRNIENQNVIQKTCSYEFSEIRRARNVSYQFLLISGEKIWIPGELLENRDVIDTQEELTFVYAEPKGGFHCSYTCIEITSDNGSLHFVNHLPALKEVQLGIIVNLLIAVPILLLCYIPIMLKIFLKKTGDGSLS